MKLSRGIFVAAILGVAGLSFAAGRALTPPRLSPPAMRPAFAVEQLPEPDVSAAPTLPEQVADIAGLSFVETYRLLKNASSEMVRTYCNKLLQLPNSPAKGAALTMFFKTLIQANPRLTKDLILSLKKEDRWLPMSAIREAATPRGMEAVAEVLLGFDRIEISGCSYDLLRDTLDEWGKNDPLALKQFLETHRQQDVERYFGTLILNWAAYDPEAAQEWMATEIQERPFIPTRPTEDGGEEVFDSEWRYAVESMSSGWVQGFLMNDPDRAAHYIVEHVDNEAVRQALYSLAGDLFLVSPERARDLILRLPTEQQSTSLRSVADKANMLVKSEAADNTTSPRHVAEWMLEFSPDAYREGIGWVLRSWEMSNPQELFAWMADLPPPIRDQMVRRFPSISSETTQEEFDTLMTVPDATLRTQLLEQSARDAGSAEKQLRRVLEKSQLPAQERARLASLIPKSEYETATADEDAE